MKTHNNRRKKKLYKQLITGNLKVSQVINNEPYFLHNNGNGKEKLMQRYYIYKRKNKIESFMIKKIYFERSVKCN